MLIFKLFVLFVLLLMTKYYINLFSETKRLIPQKRLRLLIIVKTNLTICFHHSRFAPRHSVTKTLNSQTLNLAQKKNMLSAALGFPKGKRITDHYSTLVLETTTGFSQELLPP